ncbi:geminin DNA replication inhibitor [Leptinotarsa decemlineata]|uniref:geminin DNA replication inhibitor n=1 Tax=Leptinotarsa decemlineata TaxID=7539 RepID=UPI003D3072F1
MKTDKKTLKVISQDQEIPKNSRRTLRDLQKDASGKENLVGRSHTIKDSKIYCDLGPSEAKKKSIQMLHKSVQVGECTITTEDLTSDEPSADYWKRLAETRGNALDESLHENEKLKENLEALQEENRICKEMLDESRHLVEVLKEIINEQDEEEDSESVDTKTKDSD